MMIKKVIKYFLFIFLFIVSVGKIKAEPLAAGNYKIGDEVTYNDMKFYVIADSDEKQDYVTMLKSEPLTVDEVNKYGTGHVNIYTPESVGTAYNKNGYGEMVYYSSPTCRYTEYKPGYTSSVTTDCTTDYAQSEVKYAVDSWSADKIKSADLKVDSTGYSARLLTLDELQNNLGYNNADKGNTSYSLNAEYTPSWVYNNNYCYWTMSQDEDSAYFMWYVGINGNLNRYSVYDIGYVVRPVVTLKKVVESDKLQPSDNDINSSNSDIESSNTIQKVDVPDTLKNRVIVFSIIGSAMIIVGLAMVVLILKNRRNNKNRSNRGGNL